MQLAEQTEVEKAENQRGILEPGLQIALPRPVLVLALLGRAGCTTSGTRFEPNHPNLGPNGVDSLNVRCTVGRAFFGHGQGTDCASRISRTRATRLRLGGVPYVGLGGECAMSSGPNWPLGLRQVVLEAMDPDEGTERSLSESKRNPPWERDELILALELYFEIPFSKVGTGNPKVIALSHLLNALPIHAQRTEKFRNPSGVAMKLGNFASLDPDYTTDGRKGLAASGNRDREVWFMFSKDKAALAATAESIRKAYKRGEVAAPPIPEDEEEEFAEGRVLFRLHRSRERNKQVVEAAKRRAWKKHGALVCAVCQFDFAHVYGDLGEGYIEAHHVQALSSLVEESKTKPSDLALVCSNCHRMLHRRRPWLSPVDLKSLVNG